MKVFDVKVWRRGRKNEFYPQNPIRPIADVFCCRIETDKGPFVTHAIAYEGENGIFKVDGVVTREHMAAILHNFASAIERMDEKESVAA